MYHVFEYEYESSSGFKGSRLTLKEAYDLVQGDTAELYENTAEDLTLKHVADFFEESHDVSGKYERKHVKRGWFFLEEKLIEVIDEYTERWENNIEANTSFKTTDGRAISVTGWIPQGRWVQE